MQRMILKLSKLTENSVILSPAQIRRSTYNQAHFELKLILLSLLTVFIFTASRAQAEKLDYESLLASRPARDVIWSFDSSLVQYFATLPDGSKLKGSAGSFTAGYGKTRGNSWFTARFHILAGPWDAVRDGAFDSDFSGTMLDVDYGTSFPGMSLRSGSVPILAIAAGYLDLNGRNIGGNRKARGNSNEPHNYYVDQDFRVSTGALVVTPTVGWSWVKSPRPTGSEPELLLTRLESAAIRIGIMIPVYSRARVDTHRRNEGQSLSIEPTKLSSKGQLKGYAAIVTASLWLGI